MYGEHISEFGGLPVVDFDDANSWQGPQVAYRVREEYDDEVSLADRIDVLLHQPGADQLAGLIVGAWSRAMEGESSKEFIASFVAEASRLPRLRSLFIGEMIVEECEISWINQTDVSPVLKAFPQLQELRVRGGNGLAFSRIRHDGLRSLAIETGGLPRSVIREVFQCEFPNLEHLELLLGEENYGFDGSVEDLQPLLSGRLFPKLRFLGLMNSTIANDIAAVVVNSPIVARIETLDLSLGNLDAEGVRSLSGLATRSNLKRLNISHHFAPQQEVDRLIHSVPFEVIAEDRAEPEDDWRPIVHAE